MKREFVGGIQDEPGEDNAGRAPQEAAQSDPALRESEGRLRSACNLFESVTAGAETIICAVDRQLRYTYFNQIYHEEIRRLTGQDPKLGHSVEEVFAGMPEQRAIVVREWTRTLRGESSDFRVEFGEPDRYRRVYSVRHTPVRDAGGHVVGAGEVAWDITEGIRAISDNIPGGATYQNVTLPDGTVRYTHISSGVERLFGLSAQSVMEDSGNLRQLVVEEDRPRVSAAEQEALRDATPFDCQFRWRTAAGEIKWVHCCSTPHRRKDGSIVWSGVIIDITARKRAEAEASARQVRLAMALEAAGMVTWEWDIPDRSIRYLDNIGAIVHGAPVEPSCSLDALMADVHPEDRVRLAQALERTSGQGDPFECEYRTRMADGTYRWILGKGKRAVMEKGKPVTVLGLSIDITERKMAEELQRHRQRLESIGRLAGGVAHEINNPLTGIMGFAQLIATGIDRNNPLAEYAWGIVRLTERVAAIVHSLLIFARHETQSHSPADIRGIVGATLALIQTVMPHDQIAVEMDIPGNLPAIRCRSQQIQQVLMNLLTNARDALNEKYPEGNPDKIIRVTARVFEKAGNAWVRTTVEDHGTGIPPGLQEKLFDPFFTTKEPGKGTGLGLAISHGIVEEHHGELHCESEPGRWTKFHMDLPVDDV